MRSRPRLPEPRYRSHRVQGIGNLVSRPSHVTAGCCSKQRVRVRAIVRLHRFSATSFSGTAYDRFNGSGACAHAFQIGLGQGQPVPFQRKDAPRVVRLCRKLHALGLLHREVGLRLRQRQLVVGGVDPQHFRPRRDQTTRFKVRMAPDHLALHLGHGDPGLGRAQVAPSGCGGPNILRRDRHHPNG